MRDLYAGSAAGVLVLAMVVATWAGSGWSMIALAPLVAIKRTRRFALAMLATLVASSAVVFVLKALVRRPRPFVSVAGIVPLSGAPSDFSFPSGHAAGSATFAAFVVTSAWFASRAGEVPLKARPLVALCCALAVAFALMVASSRVYLGVHYPLDVTFGSLVGATIGVAGASWYRSAVRPRQPG